MKVLITGNLGYVGSVLTRFLANQYPEIEILGYDIGYYGQSLTDTDCSPEIGLSVQYFKDIRKIEKSILQGVDAVVHLAGISNDPIGQQFELVTEEINRKATLKLAKIASLAGVKNFVFASSCSMYGEAGKKARKETDQTNPLTAYAKSKIGSEQDIQKEDLGNMIFTSLRFGTACGWSNRLRLDLALNDFVACAITSGEISVLSDGSPWRPLIDVQDMCRAIIWSLLREVDNGGKFLAVNVGKNSSNYQIKEIAYTVSKLIPGTSVKINTNASPDNRSYTVDFNLFEKLAPNYQPKISLEQSIINLKNGLNKIEFNDRNFRNSHLMRLNTLKKHISNDRLDKNLCWKSF